MQTFLHELFRDTPEGREADRILRSCVHCGFCLQSCPTYLVTNDEADSPRGRIVLMRAMSAGRLDASDPVLATHLDRCLGCRACEPVCPSGVQYGAALEDARRAAARAAQLFERRLPTFSLPSASIASHSPQGAVQLEHALAAGLLVQAVDVLGDHGLQIPLALQRGQPAVRWIRRGLGQDRQHALNQLFPDFLRIAPQRVDMGDFHGVDFFPQAAGAAEGRDPAFNGNAGPR